MEHPDRLNETREQRRGYRRQMRLRRDRTIMFSMVLPLFFGAGWMFSGMFIGGSKTARAVEPAPKSTDVQPIRQADSRPSSMPTDNSLSPMTPPKATAAPVHEGGRTPKPKEQVLYIVVDKQTCTLTGYADTSAKKVIAGPWPCTVGANHGDKQAKNDMKTPEGRHVVINIQDSSGWEFEGQPGSYGPWFLRLRGKESTNKQWTSIGIHGTNEPDRLGTAASHGCVRLSNDHISLLRDAVKKGRTAVDIRP